MPTAVAGDGAREELSGAVIWKRLLWVG